MSELQADNPYGLCSAEEAAVIEAAEDVSPQGCLAAERLTRQEFGDEYGDKFVRLYDALRALQEARDE